MINRLLKDRIFELRKFYRIITITGPRQSGKTTLCRSLFPDLPYVNFEDISTRMEAMNDVKKFIQKFSQGVIIDEAHNFPDIFSAIQVEVDEDIFQGKKERLFIVTGSSNFSLLEKVTQSMAGRTAILTLLPLSIKELGDSIKDISTDKLILYGGYPAIWANLISPEILFSDYYSTYIERDARQVVNIKEIMEFHRFVRLCAGRIGSEFNASMLSNEVGVTTKTIKSWLNILGASYILYLLPPYYENIGKRLTKSPKIYFYDTGLAAYLLGILNENNLQTHPLRGALFENLVINEMIKERYNKGKDNNFFFYRDKSQKEIDVIQWNGIHLSAFEIKSGLSYRSDFFKNINYLKTLLKDKINCSAIIYDGTSEQDRREHGIYNFRNFCLDKYKDNN
jgi:predicted AAA+ superfamily ATPase